MNPIIAWLASVGRQSADEREMGHLDGEALLLMIEAAGNQYAEELAEAIALLNTEYA